MTIRGLDEWLTTDPSMDDYDDTICFYCSADLEKVEYGEWVDDGFCSKKCFDDQEHDNQCG